MGDRASHPRREGVKSVCVISGRKVTQQFPSVQCASVAFSDSIRTPVCLRSKSRKVASSPGARISLASKGNLPGIG